MIFRVYPDCQNFIHVLVLPKNSQVSKIEIKMSSNSEFSWVLKGFQNVILVTSSLFKTEKECRLSIEQFLKANKDLNFHKKVNKQGDLFFEQIDTKGHTICKSRNYQSELALELAIRSLKIITEDAPIVSTF